MTRDERERLLAALQASEDGRERKRLFTQVRPWLEADEVEGLAGLVREPSPRIAARMTALLARHGLRDAFEGSLPGLPAGKIALLRAQFERMAASSASGARKGHRPG